MQQVLIKQLKRAGYRLTKPRQAVLEVLSREPQTALQIRLLIRQRGQLIDQVTVYRTLECLVGLGLVTKTKFKDQTFWYELKDSNRPHHHHLVCDRCGQMEEVLLDESILLRVIARRSKFKVLSHQLEFFGLCPACLKK